MRPALPRGTLLLGTVPYWLFRYEVMFPPHTSHASSTHPLASRSSLYIQLPWECLGANPTRPSLGYKGISRSGQDRNSIPLLKRTQHPSPRVPPFTYGNVLAERSSSLHGLRAVVLISIPVPSTGLGLMHSFPSENEIMSFMVEFQLVTHILLCVLARWSAPLHFSLSPPAVRVMIAGFCSTLVDSLSVTDNVWTLQRLVDCALRCNLEPNNQDSRKVIHYYSINIHKQCKASLASVTVSSEFHRLVRHLLM
jgi:hypothetical protein